MNAIVYLLQVSACVGIFYLFYYLLLSRYTFFTINRWYLVITLAICFIIPLLTITVHQQESYPQVIQQVVYINKMQVPQDVVITNDARQNVEINWAALVSLIYTVSVGALLLRLLLVVVKFLTRVSNKKKMKIAGVHIVKGDKHLSNGSFFNYIFLNDNELSSDELEQIIAHEMLHVKLYHSADRILVKIAQVFLWFNPFVYLYASAIEENHEFEVDRAISNSTDRTQYAELLFHLSVARQGTLYHNFSMVPLKKRITMLFTKPTNRMRKVIYLLVIPVVLISCLAFAKLENEEPDVKKTNVSDVADTTKVKYRQKTKRTAAQVKADDEGKAKMLAYMQSPEGKEKMELSKSLGSKVIAVTVLDDYTNKQGRFTGKIVKEKTSGNEFLLLSWYGQGKQLNNQLSKGDELSIKVFGAGAGPDLPVTITPAYVVKNGKEIFRLVEADKIPVSPFLYEANKVRFADGQITNITKYANGKWKTAVFERVNGYKFNLSFKPGAPDLNSIKDGDHVRLRFIHEAKTGAKTYKVNDWVALSADISDYGIKNPDWFYKFYEPVKIDAGKVGVINGIKKPDAKAAAEMAKAAKDTVGNGKKTFNEMVANLSGFETRADGSRWFNGKKVNKIMLNGKEFIPDATQTPKPVTDVNGDLKKTMKIIVDGKEFIPDATQTPKPIPDVNGELKKKVKIMVDGKEFIPDADKPADKKSGNIDVTIKKDLINSVPAPKSANKNLNDSLVAARFSGKVVTVKEIMGTTYLIIVKNGEYFAAYSNLKNVNVSNGQEIKDGQVLGVAAAFNPDENKVAAHFELYRNQNIIKNKEEQEVIIRDLGQQRLNMRLKSGAVYAFKP
ncbi:M56 family metallopeptidase [Mucilaginibacter calamicampi]|uniref:M56 family metallopeptidase n=1 Tax=Mucilaginibacter calamicampi TaxID=1302352 RepID=A0ABW2YU20_9SPHI